MKQTITTSIDKEDYAALESIAGTEDRSVASLVRRATREYLERHGFNKPEDAGFNKPAANRGGIAEAVVAVR